MTIIVNRNIVVFGGNIINITNVANIANVTNVANVAPGQPGPAKRNVHEQIGQFGQ